VGGFPGGMGGGGAVDLNQVLNQMFGGGMGGGMGGGGGHGPPMAVQPVECTLEELYSGANRTVRHNGKPFRLAIQPGWKPGTKLKFEDDRIAFEVTQADHAVFTRRVNDLHCSVFPSLTGLVRGETQEIKTLDGRRLRVPFAPFALRAVVRGEGMPYKEADVSGARIMCKGELVVHLFADLGEATAQIQSWLRVVMMVAVLWLFLMNPMMGVMLFMGYQALRNNMG